jgi:DNA-directed RNA polymerase specialized sigma24 family protein
MSDHLNPMNSKGQVERLARSYHQRFRASYGASLTVEDLAQEFWIVWHAASQRFDPARGYDFRALLGVSIRNRAVELAKFHGRRLKMAAISLSETAGTGEDASELVELIESPEPSAEAEMLRRERTELLLSRIDDRLRKMVELLTAPPETLEREIAAGQAKAAFAATLGIKVQAPREVTLTMLTDLFGLSRCSRYRFVDQLKEVMTDYD